MTQDAYWDELGLAWKAIIPDPQVMVPTLKKRLRRQTAMIAIILLLVLPLSLAGIALGFWTIWFGFASQTWNFIPRGVGIVLIALMAAFAAWSFRGELRDGSASLRAMIDLALSRAEKWHRAVQLAFLSCGVAAIFGWASYGVAAYFQKPHRHWPVEALVINIFLGLASFLLLRRAREAVVKYRHLKRLLEEG